MENLTVIRTHFHGVFDKAEVFIGDEYQGYISTAKSGTYYQTDEEVYAELLNTQSIVEDYVPAGDE